MANIVQRLCKCILANELPSVPLATGGIQLIDISQNRETCKFKGGMYYVKKVRDDNEYTLYAVSFVKEEIPFTKNSRKGSKLTRYKNQLAYMECKLGWIDFVFVTTDARHCGISKVLSMLCMLDPDINKPTAENEVFQLLKRSKKEGPVKFLHDHCINLVGLDMQARDEIGRHDGGYAYINAASSSKYNYLVVQVFDREEDKCIEEFLNYQISWIKRDNLFNGTTGLIEDMEGTGYMATWYFCRSH